MAVENITLNLIPTGDTPSIHVAQFDVDRPFTVTLKEGADDFTPTGYDIELQVRKVDNNIVTTVPTQTSGNVITFNTTEQMTACSGTNIAELQLTKDSQTFATLHFYLIVQRDVLAGGLTSQSEIYDLEEQIAAIVPEVIGDEYYTAEEVDEKIAEIPTFDPTNYYDKSDVNALLNDKADVSDLPDMTDYYTKSEVDTKITDLYQIKSATGSIVHITDGGNAIPVKSLTSEIVAVETGNGQPKSPTNPYIISGFDSGVITRCGVNLLSGTLEDYQASTRTYGLSTFIAYKLPNGTYTISTNAPTGYIWAGKSLDNGTLDTTSYSRVYDGNTMTITLSGTQDLIVGILTTDMNTALSYNTQLEVGNQVSTYEAYNGNTYTFAFGQTVYGGHFDNKGNLVVTHKVWITNGTEIWIDSGDGNYYTTSHYSFDSLSGSSDGKSNYFTYRWSFGQTNGCMAYTNRINLTKTSFASVEDLQTAFNQTPLVIVYPLANPITLSITSQDIPTLLGENNIFSNCGDVEVEYFTEKSDGIAELIKAFI